MDIRRFTQQICRDADVKDIRVIERKIGSHNSLGNKRKRRSSLIEKDFDHEHEHEAKRRYISSCSMPATTVVQKGTSTSSSSERSSPLPSPLDTDLIIESDSAVDTNSPGRLSEEYDGDYDSPGRQFEGASSPSSCHSIANCTCSSWHTRGDVTPHSKQPCRRLRHPFSPESALQCCIKSTAEMRPCPLPALSWANALDVWKVMCRKDEVACLTRTANMLENHPGLQPRMRAILLDWLIEVCEVYKLHRETYYLAVDYLDRYLSCNNKVQITHLQLIGITCLFVAAKVEEIYPPKIGEFAYVTDGACQEEDILQQELLLLKALDWNISPVTILGWLGVYMQLNVNNRTPSSFVNHEPQLIDFQLPEKDQSNASVNKNDKCKVSVTAGTSDDCKKSSSDSNSSSSRNNNRNSCKRKLDDLQGCSSRTSDAETEQTDSCTEDQDEIANLDDSFIYPQFSGMEFVQTAQLLDLCTLDLGVADFSYSVIAAAAMSHTFTREIAVRVSGLDWSDIAPCAQWMSPFFDITSEESQHLFLLEQNEQVKSKFGLGHVCPNIVTDDSHIIQTHTTSIDMFEKAIIRREYYQTATHLHVEPESSPAIPPVCPEGLLTPPSSSRKPLDVESENEAHV